MWTTQAQFADYIFLLARTDPDAPKHAGISYLLVPMKQPGIEVRPIAQVDGSADFNEIFFTNARCPRENVVGGENNGWKVAMTTLGFERGIVGHHRPPSVPAASSTRSSRRPRRTARPPIPLIRQRLARAWTKVKIMEINGYRSLTDALNGTHHMAALGACNKMFWSEYHQEVMDLAIDILGMDGQILTGDPDDMVDVRLRRGRDDYPVSDLQASFFFSRSETIWGGTAEIQRNIVGERVLGLPKEPKPATASS